jgi:DNA polymerase-3 subunit epsilon
MTISEYRQATVRWARRAVRPGGAVIIGLCTTAPGSGSLIEIAVIEADHTIRLNTLVNPRTPIIPVTRRDHHVTDDMLAGAPCFGQILSELITITDGRSIAAYNSDSPR